VSVESRLTSKAHSTHGTQQLTVQCNDDPTVNCEGLPANARLGNVIASFGGI
jgi:hypothetical protein